MNDELPVADLVRATSYRRSRLVPVLEQLGFRVHTNSRGEEVVTRTELRRLLCALASETRDGNAPKYI